MGEMEKGMGEMGKAFFDDQIKGHEAITKVMGDLGKLGYLVRGINYYDDGFLVIKCRCPQVNEGSNEENPLSMDGVSESVKV
jgi:hypothetical protein